MPVHQRPSTVCKKRDRMFQTHVETSQTCKRNARYRRCHNAGKCTTTAGPLPHRVPVAAGPAAPQALAPALQQARLPDQLPETSALP